MANCPLFLRQSGEMADTPDLKSGEGLFPRMGSSPISGTNNPDFIGVFLLYTPSGAFSRFNLGNGGLELFQIGPDEFSAYLVPLGAIMQFVCNI